VTAALLALALAAAPAAAAPVAVEPGAARPGDAVLVRVRAPGEPRGTLAGRPLAFWRRGDEAWALAALPIETPPGGAPVEIALEGGEPALATTVAVVEPGFRSKSIRVPERYVVPPPEVKARIKRDGAAFAAAWRQPFSPPLFAGRFEWPRPEETGGRFGDRRILNGKKESIHYGVDIGAPRGAPVHAANDGEVVLARNCYYSGKTVVLWHGADLFTAYFHLDRLAVKRGRKVRKGEAIGAVGSTGRSTGPHLHWSVKAAGLYVDPESVLAIDFAGGTAPPRRPGPAPEPAPVPEAVPEEPDAAAPSPAAPPR